MPKSLITLLRALCNQWLKWHTPLWEPFADKTRCRTSYKKDSRFRTLLRTSCIKKSTNGVTYFLFRHLCGTDIHQRYDYVKRVAKGSFNDLQNLKTFKSENNQCWGGCQECKVDASGSRHFEFESSDANPIFIGVTADFKGRWTKAPVHASVKRRIPMIDCCLFTFEISFPFIY